MNLTIENKIHFIGIVICSVMIIGFSYIIEIENNKSDKYESFVGKTIEIGKDTLVVTDYNSSNNTYNLSNRVIVDREYILKNAK
jgi:hypothetical protein